MSRYPTKKLSKIGNYSLHLKITRELIAEGIRFGPNNSLWTNTFRSYPVEFAISNLHIPLSNILSRNKVTPRTKKKTQNLAIPKTKKKNQHPSQQIQPQASIKTINTRQNRRKIRKKWEGGNLCHFSEWIQTSPCLFNHLEGQGKRRTKRSDEGDGGGGGGRGGRWPEARRVRRGEYQDSALFSSFPSRLRGAEPKWSRRL